jgi:hypothetical protein
VDVVLAVSVEVGGVVREPKNVYAATEATITSTTIRSGESFFILYFSFGTSDEWSL